jgi:CubicO group peptidase (beta-lactamase class C family)
MPAPFRKSSYLILLCSIVGAAANADNLPTIAAYLESTYQPDRPGAAVIIASNGEIVHEAGYGLANVEHGIAVTPDTVFRIGSITKQFTAASIMLLEQRGLLSVDDPIDKYLPDYPTHGHVITIEHLLTHTSGIRSYTDIPGYMGNPVRADLTTAELIDVFDNEPMDFAPGDQWRYNNSGYVLLGAIIETVSGQSYETFIADNIATPLNLAHTYYGGPKIIPHRAAGYEVDGDDNIVNAAYLSMTQPHAAGSLLSTTGDLFAWHKALTGGEFVHDDSYERMTRAVSLNDGSSDPYGYGLGLLELRGRKMIAHGGGINGFSCYVLWLPQEDVYVAVLTNSAGLRPRPMTVAKTIAAMFIGDPYPARKAVELSENELRGLVGSYAGENFPSIDIRRAGDGLEMDIGGFMTLPVLAESRDLLFMPDSLSYVTIEWEDGQARRLLFHEEGQPPDIVARQPE